MTMARRAVAGLLFAALLATGVRPSLLRLLAPPHRPPDVPGSVSGIDRRPLRLANDPMPASLDSFLSELRVRTTPGERIGLQLGWPADGFSYGYWRAHYMLAGRTVLPPMNVVAPEDATVIAVWKSGYGDPRYDLVFVGHDGAIARRR